MRGSSFEFHQALSRELITFGDTNNVRVDEDPLSSPVLLAGEDRREGYAKYEFGAFKESHTYTAANGMAVPGEDRLIYYLEASTWQNIMLAKGELFEAGPIDPLALTLGSVLQVVETRYFAAEKRQKPSPVERHVVGKVFTTTDDGRRDRMVGTVPVLGEEKWYRLWPSRRGQRERDIRDYDTVLRAFHSFNWELHFLPEPDQP